MHSMFDLPLTWATAASVALGMLALYVARTWAHAVIRAVFGVVTRFLRVLGRSATAWAHHCRERHRLLLVHLQAEELEVYIDSRRRRAESLFQVRLAHYPELHHRLARALDRFDGDYRGVATPPVAAAPPANTGTTAIMPGPEDHRPLTPIPSSPALNAAPQPSRRQLAAVSRAGRRLAPVRRDLAALRDMDRRIDAAGRDIAAGVAEYKALLAGDSRHAASAGRSAFVLVLVGLLVAVAAIGGAALNFRLIARPLSEIVGEGFQVFGYPLADVLALGIILVEAVAGALFMDFLGVTRLFPVADRLEDRQRRILAVAIGGVLLTFALIEASLALVRQDIVQLERQLGTATGSGGGTPPNAPQAALHWLPQVVQATLGFVMPWVLALVAIPLEQLLKYGRVLVQAAGAMCFGGVAALIRTVAGVMDGLRRVMLSLYDLVVFLPLFVEHHIRRRARPAASDRDEAG